MTNLNGIEKLWTPPQHAAILVFAAAFAALAIALGYEHIGGLQPCPLCYQERWAYYAALALAGPAAWLYSAGRTSAGHALLALCGLGFLANAGVGIYHAGVEWKWWAGPTACSGGGGLSTNASDLFSSLEHIKVVRCDEAGWRFLGLSFAGYNALISTDLAILSGLGVFGLGHRSAD